MHKVHWIGAILPKDASKFFFFDGEEIQKYIQNKEAYIKEAIVQVLGVKELLNAEEDLRKIHAELRDEWDKNIRKHAKDERSRKRLELKERKLKNLLADIKNYKMIKAGAENERKALDQKQKEYEEIRPKVEDRTEAEERLEEQKELADKELYELAAARTNTGLILLYPLLAAIAKTKNAPPSEAQWQSEVARRMVDLDRCICNRPIDRNVKNLLSSKILKSDRSGASILRAFANRMLVEHEPKAKWDDLRDHLENMSKIHQEINKQESVIKRLDREIGDVSTAQEMKELQERHLSLTIDIKEHERSIQTMNRRKLELENEVKSMQTEIGVSTANDDVRRAWQTKSACEKLIRCIGKSVDRFYKTRKPELESHITHVFTRLTNNPDHYNGLKINNHDFGILVMRNDGTELPSHQYSPSAGASQIVATAMIGGLNKFSTRDAPVIIDTPMARLDPHHRKNLIDYYSKMGRQVIILYQPSEMADADIQAINNHLASEWEIDSHAGRPDLSYIRKKRAYI